MYDETGSPLTSNLTTCAFPDAAELPSFETAHTETPTPRNPLGAKGIGEAGTTGAIPAVQNAVVDALADLGVRHLDMPTTPERIWRAIADAPEGGDQGGMHGATGHEGPDRGDRDPDAEDFSVDETSLRRYVRWLSEQGVAGLAVNVDTSEAPPPLRNASGSSRSSPRRSAIGR